VGALPATGSPLSGLIALGAALALGGAALQYAGRHRREA
jgi:LPXTG-motif cell wall-anchored protein